MISDLILLVPALTGFLVLVWLRRRKIRTKPLPVYSIVVDGSNVMHWGGDPSADVLARVLRSLEAKGYRPIVFFDASVGYRLGDSYFSADKLAPLVNIPASNIRVVDKGVVADEAILAFAYDHDLRIVTNDQFREWRVRFPHACKKGRLLRGNWRQGSVVWRGTL